MHGGNVCIAASGGKFLKRRYSSKADNQAHNLVKKVQDDSTNRKNGQKISGTIDYVSDILGR
jgi:hypothetical protein